MQDISFLRVNAPSWKICSDLPLFVFSFHSLPHGSCSWCYIYASPVSAITCHGPDLSGFTVRYLEQVAAALHLSSLFPPLQAPTAVPLITIALFFSGSPFSEHERRSWSPTTIMVTTTAQPFWPRIYPGPYTRTRPLFFLHVVCQKWSWRCHHPIFLYQWPS